MESDEAVDRWLQFYEMDSAFTCLSVLISNDPVRRSYKAKSDLESTV